MKKEFNNLVYIISNANIKGHRIIRKLIEYGGSNTERLSGGIEDYCYFITPENTIYSGPIKHVLPILGLAGYSDITAELGIVEYTIEEIAKLLGKDPNSIRIKK